MNQFLSRTFYLFRYHHLQQFFWRLCARIGRPIKYFAFSRLFTHRNQSPHLIHSKIPSLDSYPNRSLPLSRTDSKYPTLKQFPNETELQTLHKQFEYHSHSFLLNSEITPKIWDTITDWIDRYPFGMKNGYRTAWHPYVCSKRVQTWLGLWVLLPPTDSKQSKINEGLLTSLRWIESNLEKDIGGNHLWENYLTITLGGLFFEGSVPNRWSSLGISGLKHCLKNQILDSGEHFEKSPSYQKELLNGLRFILPWLLTKAPHEMEFFSKYVTKMDHFLSQIAHPSGILPFFNDAWETRTLPYKGTNRNWAGDLFVCREDSLFFIFDAGNLGPDSLPAHSHCDLLTFELSFAGNPIFVNSGTYCYQGPKRNIYRGSKSHNVLVVNDENSADIWSSFRMGRRGHVRERFTKADSLGTWVVAAHDAYKKFRYPSLFRSWFISKDATFLCSIHFAISHDSTSTVQEFIHLHPKVRIENLSDKNKTFSLSHESLKSPNDSTLFFNSILKPQTVEFRDSTYAPNFEFEIPNKTVVISNSPRAKEKPISPLTAWSLSSNKNYHSTTLEIGNNELKLKWLQANQSFESCFSLSIP